MLTKITNHFKVLDLVLWPALISSFSVFYYYETHMQNLGYWPQPFWFDTFAVIFLPVVMGLLNSARSVDLFSRSGYFLMGPILAVILFYMYMIQIGLSWYIFTWGGALLLGLLVAGVALPFMFGWGKWFQVWDGKPRSDKKFLDIVIDKLPKNYFLRGAVGMSLTWFLGGLMQTAMIAALYGYPKFMLLSLLFLTVGPVYFLTGRLIKLLGLAKNDDFKHADPVSSFYPAAIQGYIIAQIL